METIKEQESKQARQERMYELVKIWLAGNQSQLAYCQQVGMSRSAFQHWVSKYRQEEAKSEFKDKGKFLPIKVIKSSHPVIELVLPSGAVLRFYHPIDLGLLQTLSK
jgi:hypothetical protein